MSLEAERSAHVTTRGVATELVSELAVTRKQLVDAVRLAEMGLGAVEAAAMQSGDRCRQRQLPSTIESSGPGTRPEHHRLRDGEEKEVGTG